MKVVRNYLYNAGYQVLAIIVPLITSYYVSRTLQPQGVGINAFTNSIIQYFVLFANMGIGFYGNREIAYVRDNRKQISKTFWEIQIVKTVMTILSYAFFLIFMYFYTRNPIYMWAQSVNLIAVAFDISWFYQGIEDFKKTVIRNTLVKVLSMLAIFIFIKDSSDLTLYILLLAISTFLGNITLWPSLHSLLEKIKFSELDPLPHFKPMAAMFVPQIATQVYVQLNRTMVGIMVSEKASGYYQYSDGMVKLVLALITATGTVMLPHVANAVAKGNMKFVNSILYKSFDFVSAISFPMAFGLAGIAVKLAPLYYGAGYAPVGTAMFIESIVIILIGWSNVIGIQYLLPTNNTKDFTTSVTLGAVVNIVLNIPMIYIGGLNGAMISTIFSEIAVTVYQLWSVRLKLDFGKLFDSTWKYLFASVVMFIFVYNLDRYLAISWIMLFIEIMGGIIVYLIILLFLRPQVIRNGKQLISRQGNRKDG